MSTLAIHRAKPNPAGKDTCGGFASAAQLLGEWADLRNNGTSRLNLAGYALANLEFSDSCVPKPNAVIYWQGHAGEILEPGQTLRVHTGKASEVLLMKYEDAIGTDVHSYANRGWFVLNNRCGDTISLWQNVGGAWQWRDAASYDRNPPEGTILIRQGQKLVAMARSFVGIA